MKRLIGLACAIVLVPSLAAAQPKTPEEWYKAAGESVTVSLDKWLSQPHYIAIMYEAKAMTGQFREYAPDITLFPLGGDPSIPFKSRVAKHLAAMAGKYKKPVRVFYFGDCDEKGAQIATSALKDIQQWARVDFSFQRVGLTLTQARSMGVPENPDKPGEYQWEALTDDQAASLIRSVTELIDRQAWEGVGFREEVAAEKMRELIRQHLVSK
jgi:hypothetical protein